MTATTTRKTRVAKAAASQAVNKARATAGNAVYALGVRVGSGTRKTLAETEDQHKVWAKAGKAGKAEMEKQFTVGVIAGLHSCTKDQAETIFAGSRPGTKKPKENQIVRSAAQQRVYDAARKQCSFHLTRLDKRGSKGAAPKARSDMEVQGLIAALCGKVYAEGVSVTTLEALRDQIALMIPRVRKEAATAAAA